MRSKESKIISFDISKEAQKACKELAIKNNVEDSIQIESEFHPSILKDYKHTKSLLICDVEGDEKKLLDIINYSEGILLVITFLQIGVKTQGHQDA